MRGDACYKPFNVKCGFLRMFAGYVCKFYFKINHRQQFSDHK